MIDWAALFLSLLTTFNIGIKQQYHTEHKDKMAFGNWNVLKPVVYMCLYKIDKTDL